MNQAAVAVWDYESDEDMSVSREKAWIVILESCIATIAEVVILFQLFPLGFRSVWTFF